jgi:hypothetical protein
MWANDKLVIAIFVTFYPMKLINSCTNHPLCDQTIKLVIATFIRRLTLVLIDLYVSKLSIYKGQLLVLRGISGFFKEELLDLQLS